VRIVKQFSALLLGLALASPLASASPEQPATVSELIDAVEATYSGATSIRAEFLQVDKSRSLGTEVRQRGRIAIERPRKVRVEMGFPMTQTYVSDGTTMWAYSVKDKQVFESPELGGGGGMGILLEDLSKLGELFDVTMLPEVPGKPSVTVKLVPKKPGAFKSLQLTLSKQKYVLQDLVLVNQLDDVTQMTFSAVTMNKDIPDVEFTFVAPPGVKTVKAGAL
jgi:outer membrane lipoprotein carrier protein